MKKKFLLLSLTALMVVPVLNSCKKGENDPFLSLKSRKGRLTGEWTLKSGEEKSTTGSTTNTDRYTETEKTTTFGSASTKSDYTKKMTINKDYTFETVTVAGRGASAYTTTAKGSWGWAKKSKAAELKNKEAVVFYTESVTQGTSSSTNTSTYTGIENSEVMLLDQLKNKEFIVKIDYSYTSGGSTTTNIGTMTYEKK